MSPAARRAHALRARETAALLVRAVGPDAARAALATAYQYPRADRLYPYARLNRAAVRAYLAAQGMTPAAAELAL
jgi:hypothetical protein